MIICALYDVKADTVLTPVYTFVNEMVAKRNFSMTSQQLGQIGLSVVADNPDDFFMIKLGTLDQEHEGVIAAEHERLFCMNEVIRNGQ